MLSVSDSTHADNDSVNLWEQKVSFPVKAAGVKAEMYVVCALACRSTGIPYRCVLITSRSDGDC